MVGITGQMRSRKSPKSQNNEILSDSILDIDSQNIDNHDLLEI